MTTSRERGRDAVEHPAARCSVCEQITELDTLSRYGARCSHCYSTWLLSKRHFPDVGSKETSPRDWARALRAREFAGERLTHAQRTAWRAVLPETTHHDEEFTDNGYEVPR